jgi:multicomponent Na+:H+ antiporter subunit D
LNAVYYLPISINGFFGEENLHSKIYKQKEKSIQELIPVAILVIAMFYVGIYSEAIIKLIKLGL